MLVTYRVEIKQWQVRNSCDKEKLKLSKREIQEKFQKKLGLNVDKPRPGFGSSYDGNTSKRFFQQPAVSSSIIRIDENLIRKFGVILQVLSGYDIDVEQFQQYAINTKTLYLSLYSWFPMPLTLHKILVHGSDIIKYHLLSIEQLSEKALETQRFT